MLVELASWEQRYQAVMAGLQDGWKVAEVGPQRLGVARQSVHNRITHYEQASERVVLHSRGERNGKANELKIRY